MSIRLRAAGQPRRFHIIMATEPRTDIARVTFAPSPHTVSGARTTTGTMIRMRRPMEEAFAISSGWGVRTFTAGERQFTPGRTGARRANPMRPLEWEVAILPSHAATKIGRASCRDRVDVIWSEGTTE